MRAPLANLKSALVTGLLIVLPAWLALLLLVKLLLKLGVLVRPISKQMPVSVNHPHIVAGLALLLLCLIVGILVNTANGRSTVFMPSVPTPMTGSIFIMPSERVHPIDVPVTSMMKCISKWVTGSSKLLKAHAISNSTQPTS